MLESYTNCTVWHYSRKKKDSDARRVKIIEDRKKHSKAKVGPTYHIEKDPSKGPGGLDDRK